MKTVMASSFARFSTIGSALTLLMDLAQPLFPFAMAAFVFFLSLSLLLFAIQTVSAVRETAKQLLPFTIIMMVLSLGVWMSQSAYEGANENGLLASTFPAFEKMQNQITDLVNTNKRIADATEDIAGTSSRTAEATEELAQTAKKEISDDPRKELLNIGLPWGDQSFWESIRLSDRRALALFVQAGLPVARSKIWERARMGDFTPEQAKNLADVGFLFTKEECDLSEFVSPSKVENIQHRRRPSERKETWNVAGGFNGVVGLTKVDTAGSLALLCPKRQLQRSIDEVVATGLDYPNIYKAARTEAIKACEKESSETSFENYVALAYKGIEIISPNFYFQDELGTRITPVFPDRELTISESIVVGSLYSVAYDTIAKGHNGIEINRNDKKTDGGTIWFGYKEVLKRVCSTIAFPELEIDNIRRYEAIKRNFSSVM